ncbi:MAG: hypothetical protein GXX92_12790 [Clostridiales bacterium]|jgi:hypothetical protein|nr:hypothetical protein [Clostridiales bacterium]
MASTDFFLNVQKLVTIHNNVQKMYMELCGEGNPDIEKDGVMVEDTGYFDRKKAWIDYVKGILFTMLEEALEAERKGEKYDAQAEYEARLKTYRELQEKRSRQT